MSDYYRSLCKTGREFRAAVATAVEGAGGPRLARDGLTLHRAIERADGSFSDDDWYVHCRCAGLLFNFLISMLGELTDIGRRVSILVQIDMACIRFCHRQLTISEPL